MTLEDQIGHHLMIGITGDVLTPEIIHQFQETHAVGLIVFRPNFKSAFAFKKLLSDLEKALGRKLLIAVDHEGGRVIHLAEGITVFPDNWTLGNTGWTAAAGHQGQTEALELRRLGLDLNLAPTLDVLTRNFSPNIGIRSYGRDAKLVSTMGAARIKGMRRNGLSACAKHFPGLGAATLDPHLDLPVLGMTWAELRKTHLKPFLKAIRSGVDCVMSSHPVYPKLDASKVPATFSKKIIQNFLREKLGFKGVILSDDLEMGALRGLCPIGESAVRAVEAGHDMVLLCHDMEAQMQAHDALKAAYQSGRLKRESLRASVSRIQNLMLRRSRRFAGGKPRPEKGGAVLASRISEKGITVSLPKKFSPSPEVRVIFPKLSALAGKFSIEDVMLKEETYIRTLFLKNGISPVSVSGISISPSAAEVKKTVNVIRKPETAVFFCYDAHLFPGARKILSVTAAQKKNAAVLLRDPYDAVILEGKIPFVTAYGFRNVQIQAAVRQLCSILKAPHAD